MGLRRKIRIIFDVFKEVFILMAIGLRLWAFSMRSVHLKRFCT